MNLLTGLLAVAALLVAAWIRAAGTAVSQIPRADAHHDAAEGKRGARIVASLLDEAVYHAEHLRLGAPDRTSEAG